MPQVTTSSEAGPGTKIIYCIIIHICLWWNIYMHMDVYGRRHIYMMDLPRQSPPASPRIFKWSKCASSLPLIGRRAGPWLGDTRRGDRRNFFCNGCFWSHNLFLKIIISLVKTVYLCFYIFTPMCHISDCHVHRIYICTTEFIYWIAVTNKLSLLTYLFPFHLF